VNAEVRTLAAEYAQALRDFLGGGGEAALLRAYEIGRRALAERLGVLEMAALHQEAFVAALLELLAPEDSRELADRASAFFAESLAPFEMTRRGIQEANEILRDLNSELELRIKAAQEQLDERRRIERLKDEFISIVSHELRTPLTSIHASLALLERGLGGELTPQGCKLVSAAYRNSQRLVRLVGEVLDLQKIESGALALDARPVEVASLLTQAIEANQAYASQFGVTFVLEEAPQDVKVWGDADRLMQVMTNLLSNAAKFSPPEASVRVCASAQEGVVQVRVSDCGPGIPEHFRERVFQRFAQADSSTTRDRAGSGLGLSITKAIVERLGGRIGFSTETGRGTTFYFELPEWREAKDGAPSGGDAWQTTAH
jgi:signal transduction histidine kinase